MSKIIEELWYGTLNPHEQFGRSNPQMRRLEALMQDHLQKLSDHLDEEGREALKKYSTCMDEYLIASGEQAFCDGFSVGARIISEAFLGAGKLL